MTDIRNSIHVINFYNHSGGASIHYIFNMMKKTLVIDKADLYFFLKELSSVDDEEQFDDYVISQYDALMIAVRHENDQMFNQMMKGANIEPTINKLKNE